jgi:hypothetical protein
MLARSIDNLLAGIHAREMSVTVETDFTELKEIWPSLGRGSLNPIFDYESSFLSPGNSFWLKVTAHDNGCAAVVSSRIYHLKNLRTALISNQIYCNNRPSLRIPYPAGINDRIPPLAGCIHYCGASFVDPTHRGNRLSQLLLHLTKALAIRFFEPEWFIADCYEDVALSRLPVATYLYDAISPLAPSQGEASASTTGLLGDEPPKYLMWGHRETFLDKLYSSSDMFTGPSFQNS